MHLYKPTFYIALQLDVEVRWSWWRTYIVDVGWWSEKHGPPVALSLNTLRNVNK